MHQLVLITMKGDTYDTSFVRTRKRVGEDGFIEDVELYNIQKRFGIGASLQDTDAINIDKDILMTTPSHCKIILTSVSGKKYEVKRNSDNSIKEFEEVEE